MYEPDDESESLLLFLSGSRIRPRGVGDSDMSAGLDLQASFLPSGKYDRLLETDLLPFEVSRECSGEGDLVDMVETENEEDAERNLLVEPRNSGSSLCRSCFRPLSCSNLASCSSAIPFLKNDASS